MKNFFEMFIDERINSNYKKMQSNPKWKETNQKFMSCYNNLYNELSIDQKQKLEEMISLKNALIEFDIFFAYKLALVDYNDILRYLFTVFFF